MTQDTNSDNRGLLDIARAVAQQTVDVDTHEDFAGGVASQAVTQYLAAVESGEEIAIPDEWVGAVARQLAIEFMRQWNYDRKRFYAATGNDPTDAELEMALDLNLL